MLLVEMS